MKIKLGDRVRCKFTVYKWDYWAFQRVVLDRSVEKFDLDENQVEWRKRLEPAPVVGVYCGSRYRKNGFRRQGRYDAFEGSEPNYFECKSTTRVALVAVTEFHTVECPYDELEVYVEG